LVVDTALEASWAPVDELDSALGLDGSNSRVDILRDDITTVHHAASHVLTVTRIALGKHVGWLEDRVGDLVDGQLLVVSLLSRDDRSIGGQHKVDTRVRHQVGLELRKIDVQGTIETQGSGQGRDDLGDQTIQVGVGRTLDVQVATADVVQGLVIQAEGAVSVLQQRVGGQDVVVRLNDSSGDLRSGGHSEGKLGLATVVDGQALQQEGTETGTSSTTSGVEDHETLKTSAVVSQLADAVQHKVDDFLTDGVVTTGVVVGSIFLTGDDLLRVVQLAVGTSADFVTHTRLQVDQDSTRNVLASAGLREEGVERVISTTDSLVGWHLTIRLDTVL